MVLSLQILGGWLILDGERVVKGRKKGRGGERRVENKRRENEPFL